MVDGFVGGICTRARCCPVGLRCWTWLRLRLRRGIVAAARAISGYTGVADADAAGGGELGQARLRLDQQRARGFMFGGEADMDAVALLPHRDVDTSQRVGRKLDARVARIGIVAQCFDVIDHALQPRLVPQVERSRIAIAGRSHAYLARRIGCRCGAERGDKRGGVALVAQHGFVAP